MRNQLKVQKAPGRGRRRRGLLRWLNLRTGLVIVLLISLISGLYSCSASRLRERRMAAVDASEPMIDVQLLDLNPYSRPGMQVEQVRGIVIYYTANPGSSAQENRDYFNNLQYTQDNEVSSNFVIGIDGEIIQCVPTWEMAYASNERNVDTVSIECCHPDETGAFTDATYASVVQLTAWLCLKFGLNENDVIRHYDVTGKNCPKYYVEHEEEWEALREDVRLAMERSMQNSETAANPAERFD